MRKIHFLIAFVIVLLDRYTGRLVARDNRSAQQHPDHSTILLSHTSGESRGGIWIVCRFLAISQWKASLLVVFFHCCSGDCIGHAMARSRHSMATTGIGLALIMGGAIGNLWDDRLFSGKVVDFLLFYIGTYEWLGIQCCR